MEVLETNKSIVGNTIKSVKQGISKEKMPLAISIIRDRIYTDKLKAALFEPLSNAVDEHRKYKVTKPVRVRLSPIELEIRDFARGLSDEDIFHIFFQYFESTKNKDNQYIGGFGIGAKSPAAYTQSVYYVESRFNGRKAVFVSVVDGNNSKASLVHSEPCDVDDTGITVKIPLNSTEDYSKFFNLIKDAYQMFGFYDDKPVFEFFYTSSKQPNADYIKYQSTRLADFRIKGNNIEKACINSEYSPIYIKDTVLMVGCDTIGCGYNKRFTSDFFSISRNTTTFAYDGDNLYKINVPNDYFTRFNVRTYNHYIIFFFKRGELPISPSRETIEMNSFVSSWLEEKFELLKSKSKDFLRDLRKELENKETPTFQMIRCLERTYEKHFVNILFNDFPDETINHYSTNLKRYNINTNIISSIGKNKKYISLKYVKNNDNIIFIVCDDILNLPYLEFFKAFKTYLQTIKTNNKAKAYEENLRNYFHYLFAFVSTDEEKINFEKLCKNLNFDSKPLIRKDIDWFYLSDIKKYSTYVRPKVVGTKKIRQKPNDLIAYYTDKKIPKEEYSQTLLVYHSFVKGKCNSQFKHSFDFLRCLAKCLENHTNVDINNFISGFGLKHIAYCHKVDYKYFIEQGCIDCETFDPLKQNKKYLEDNLIVNLPYIIKICLYKLNIDFSDVTGYVSIDKLIDSNNIASTIDGNHRMLNIYNRTELSVINNRTERIEKDFINYLKKEIKDNYMIALIYLFDSRPSLPMNLHDAIRDHIKVYMEKYGDKLKEKIISILKKIDYKF